MILGVSFIIFVMWEHTRVGKPSYACFHQPRSSVKECNYSTRWHKYTEMEVGSMVDSNSKGVTDQASGWWLGMLLLPRLYGMYLVDFVIACAS